MHGHKNWMYVIYVTPYTHWIFQDMQKLSSIDETNRILDVAHETSKEGGSSKEEEIYYSSTSTNGSLTSNYFFESAFLDMGEFDTNVSTCVDDMDAVSHNTTRLNLEIVLEIDHEHLHADVTSFLI